MRFRRSTLSPVSPSTTISDVDFDRKSRTSGASIPNTPEDDTNYIRKSKVGLGIPDAPFHPDPSPIRSPESEKLAKAEKGAFTKASPSIAERIEQKLWKYSASGNIAKRWLLEIISWLLSASCMAAIIIVLFVLKNKPVPNWPLGLTLNAYITVLSRVACAALLLPASEALGQLKWSWFQGDSKKMWDFEIFDNASRGPWGSFLLLVRTKGKSLAAIGAAVTIFAMALDPFFQQVVHYGKRWELQKLPSSIPRVTRYDPFLAREMRFQDNATVINPDQDMKAIADKFFFGYGVPEIPFGNGTRAEIPLSCPSSNCTWEPYETLGVCSKCEDVADMLEFGCLSTRLDWIRSANSYDPYENGTMCGWFFNATGDKPVLMSGYQVDPDTNQSSGEILTTRALPLITNIKRTPLFGGSINFKDVRNPIANFVVVTPPVGPDTKSMLDSIFKHEKPKATECMLSWCVKTIQSSYHLGTYNESVIRRFINTTAGPSPWVEVPAKRQDIPGATEELYVQNITVDPRAVDGRGNTSGYGASNDTAFNIINIFDDYLPAMATTVNNQTEIFVKYKTYETDPFLREYSAQPFSASRDVGNHIERLATTMTNLMRTSSKENATGQAFSEETFVQVRWGWLSLPVGLLLLTFIFLLATVIRSWLEKDQVGIWKTSAVAILLYGLPDEIQKNIMASQGDGSHGTPRFKAKQLKVKMLPKQGWRVSGNTATPKPKFEPPPGWI